MANLAFSSTVVMEEAARFDNGIWGCDDSRVFVVRGVSSSFVGRVGMDESAVDLVGETGDGSVVWVDLGCSLSSIWFILAQVW